MKRLIYIILLTFIHLNIFGQIESPNTDTVWAGGTETVETNSGLSSNYYFLNNTITTVRSNGSVTDIVLYMTTNPSDSLIFEIWRKDGSTFDRVYQEDILSKVTAGGLDTITLASPVDTREGDNVALKLVGGGGIGYATSISGSMYYAPASTVLDGVDDDILGTFTSSTQYQTVKLLGPATVGVIIGNSISAGHPDHYSGVEKSLVNNPPNSIGGQLYLIDSTYKWQNMGIGGKQSIYLTQKFDTYVKPLKPKYVIIEVGVNDIYWSETKSNYFSSMTKFIDSCTANEIIPVVLKILPWTDGTNTQMQTRDDWMGDLDSIITADYPTGIFIDLDDSLGLFRSGGDADNLWDLQAAYDADGVHPNEDGYAVIASAINTALLELNIGGDYFVVPPNHSFPGMAQGSDAADGSFATPWATWQKAIDVADAGDTVWFRGGVWYPETAAAGNNILYWSPEDTTIAGGPQTPIGNSGTAGNRICFFNYPGETPVLDCERIVTSGNYNTAWQVLQAHFLHLKGLTIRNVYQREYPIQAGGLDLYLCSNVTVENFTIHDIGGKAFSASLTCGYFGIEYDTTKFINCDAYSLCDTFSYYPPVDDDPGFWRPGNAADGWKVILESYDVQELKDPEGVMSVLTFQGCRVWNQADDGIDPGGTGEIIFDSCWVFNVMGPIVIQDSLWNGTETEWVDSTFYGEGNGFKSGGISDSITRDIRTYTNNIAAFCNVNRNSMGFGDWQYSGYATNSKYYNNISYKNNYGLYSPSRPVEKYWNLTTYRNNIVYNSTDLDVVLPALEYPESHNTWDWNGDNYPWFVTTDTVTVTDDDFIGPIDSLSIFRDLSAARQADGSLPIITNFNLAPGSDLINAGVDVGLPYNGSAPDIGYSESNYNTRTSAPLTGSGNKIQVSGGVILYKEE